MRPKDEQKEKLILEKALSLIVRVGFSGLKMTDLAKEAGLATGTIYIYFEDKNALIQKLYLFLTKKTTVDLLVDIDQNMPTKLQIQALSFNYLRKNIENPEDTVFFDQYFRSNYALNMPETEQEENAMMQPIFDMVLRGQREHIIKNIDATLLVTLVCGMINELARVATFEQRTVSEQEWNNAFTVIWDGIKS